MPTTERSSDTSTDDHADPQSGSAGGIHISYGRFAAMTATSTVVMFAFMYLNTLTWGHVRWSETRFFMALLMGATMALIMLGFMISMYRSTKANIGIGVGAIVVFAAALWLVRSQETVQDTSYLRAMIPHHSIAIVTSERSDLRDLRTCDLAVGIVEAQRREIAEMDWLIADIEANGLAETIEEAEARPIPDFPGGADRTCAGDFGSDR